MAATEDVNSDTELPPRTPEESEGPVSQAGRSGNVMSDIKLDNAMAMITDPESTSDPGRGFSPIKTGSTQRTAISRDGEAPSMETMLWDNVEPQLSVADKTWFCALVSVEVLANVMALGLEVDLKCRNNCVPEDFELWRQVDVAFTIAAVVDVLVAMISMGPRVYFTGDPMKCGIKYTHILDVIVVGLRCFDVFVLQANGVDDSNLRFISALRVLHVANFITKVQLISGFRELWLIMSGMMDTLRTVIWVMALLALVLWVFAVLVAIAVASSDGPFDYSKSEWSKDDYWGSVPKCLWSLIQAMTRDRWSSRQAWPLVEASNGMILLFVAFLCVAIFALLNTIIGVVVESTLRSARENEEKENKARQKADFKIMESLQQIFANADKDGNGELTREELHEALKQPQIKQCMSLLAIPIGDLDLLFTLLDENGTGHIQSHQFFRGCARLRGPAMARDLHYVSVDLDRHVSTATQFIKTLRTVNDNISSILDTIDTIEVDIVQDESDQKDPVLVARRGRPRVSKAHFLRSNKTGETDERSDAGSGRDSALFLPPEPIEPRPRGSLAASSAMRRITGASPTPMPEGLKMKQRRLAERMSDPPPPPPIPVHLVARMGTRGNN